MSSSDDVKYTNQSGQMATPPESLEVRSTPSTEAGHTAAKIQHVKLDTGDGTNNQPITPVSSVAVAGSRVSTEGVGDIINVDCANYRSCSVQITGTWAGTVTFQASNDNTNWVSLTGQDPSVTNGTILSATTTANRIVTFSLESIRYFRARWTTVTSGTVVISAQFSAFPAQNQMVLGLAPGTSASAFGKLVDGAAGGSDTGIAILGKRVTTPAAITPANGDYSQFQLDDNGRMWANTRLQDDYGFSPEYTPTDEIRTVIPIRLVGAQFEGTTVDPLFWTATVANSATITQANAEVVLSSGTNAAGSAKLNTLRRARYVAGSSMRFRGVLQLSDTGKADNTKRWGVAWGATMPTVTDGAYFQLSGTTFSVVTLKGNTPTAVNSGSFNGTVASYAVTTNATTYEIYWTNSKVWFVVGGVLVHTVSASTATWAATMCPHVYMDNINSGNTTNTTLSCRVASIYRMGAMETQAMSYYQAGTTAGVVLKYGPGNLHGLAVSGVVNNAVVTLYDNTAASGTIIWSSGTMGANTVPFPVDLFHAAFTNGLTLVISGANANVTVVYE